VDRLSNPTTSQPGVPPPHIPAPHGADGAPKTPPGPRLSGGSARALGAPQFGGAPGGPGGHPGHPGQMPNGAPAFPFGGVPGGMGPPVMGGRPGGMPPSGMPYGFPGGMGPGGMPAGFVPGPEMRMGGMGGMGAMSGPGSPFGGPGGAPVRLSPGPSMPPAGVPMKPAAGPPVVQQRKSSAIRIVNPNSKEEVKGDFKKPDPEKKTPGEEGAEKEGDKKPAAAPAPPLAAAAAAAAGARPVPGGFPGMAPPAQGFSPYGAPPRAMMGAAGTSPGGPNDGFPSGFTVGSPDGDPAFAAAQAAQAHAHAHAHAQAMAAAMAAAGMTPPAPGGPAPPRPAMPAPAPAPRPSPPAAKPIPAPAAPKEEAKPAAPAAPAASLESAMKGLTVEEPAKAPAPEKKAEEKPAAEEKEKPAGKPEEKEAAAAAPAPAAAPPASDWKPPTEGGPAPGGEKKYTLAFLKAYEQAPTCQSKPGDLETPDDVDYWPLVDFVVPPGFGGGGGGGGRRGGRGGGPQWNGPPGGGGRGGRGGGGKWGHTGLPPDQEGGQRGRGGRGGGGFRNYGAPVSNRADPRLPQLVQTENKFVAIDKSAWDAEEKKQRAFKGILNKLTPENFDKLLEKILEEGIDEAQTLMGLIGQLFDKALTEPTFAELYATMCAALSDRFLSEGVEFKDPASPDPENPVVITFKRVLLSKCQEEFEKGDTAIKAAEKEALDAAEAKARADAGEAPPTPPEEKEEGEAPAAPKTPEELDLAERRAVLERADRMLQARRRMLGNIRFIGELFKKQMLSERIMHTCIQKLLSDPEKPDEEDVEALCKLLSTIGGQLDHAKAKSHMDAYAARIHGLSKNQTISSRHRFMCQDVLEMRSKGWRERRKQEGPKKIGDVHKDAQREASNQARGGGGGRGGGRDDRGPPRGGDRDGGRGGGRDFGGPAGRDGFRGGDRDGGRGGGRDRDGGRGGGRDRDGRGSPANDAVPRAMRGGVADAGGRLAPRSDLGRGGERGGRDAPPRPVPGPRGEKGGEKEEKDAKEAKEKAPEPASAAPASATMSDEAYETERKRVLEYFFDDKDADEAMAAISRWGGFEPRVPEFVQHLVVSGFERRTMDWDAAATLFRRLPAGAGGPASAAGIVAGVKLVLDDLEDQKCDLPKADEHLATVLAGAVADGSIAFAALAAAAAEAGPEGDAGYLREEGGAMAVLCKILAAVARAWGAPRAERALADSGVDLSAFIGTMDKEDGVTLDALLEKHGVAALPAGASLAPTRAKLAELADVSSGDALAAWIESDAGADARVSAEFAGEVAAWALAAVPADADASAPIAALAPAFAALRAACKGPGEAETTSNAGGARVGKEAREVAVLSAAQRLCAARGFPAGLLERIFRDLHAGDVLDETAMKAWRDDETSAIGLEKIAGKEKALFETMELLQEFASDDEGDAA